MNANLIRQCYRVILHPRIAQNFSVQGYPKCENAISKRSIHLSRWNIFNDDTKQRKTRGEPKDVEHNADSTSKQVEANEFEERIRKLPKERRSTYFDKLRRGSFLKVPSSSTTLRITIPNKAREYNENVRQKISSKILKIVGRFSMNSSKHGEQMAEVIIKPAKPVQSKEKDIYMKDSVDKTDDNSALTEEKSSADAKVTEYVTRHMAPPPSTSPPIMKCGCLGSRSSFSLTGNAAVSTDAKGDFPRLNAKRSSKRPEEEEGEIEEEPARVTGKKKSSRGKGKQKSLLEKYAIKSPSTLDTGEFTDQNNAVRSPFASQNQNRRTNLKSPLYMKYSKNQDNLRKTRKNTGDMSLGRKTPRKRVKKNKESKTADEMLTKLGLVDEKNLKSKIDGDLYMNICEILEKEEKKTIPGSKADTEDMERDLVKAKKKRGDREDLERSQSPRRKTATKKRKRNKSDIEQFLEGDVVRQFPVNKKLKLSPRKPTSKSKNRRISVKKGTGVKRKRSRKVVVIKEKKTKSKKGVEDCGDLSQNE